MTFGEPRATVTVEIAPTSKCTFLRLVARGSEEMGRGVLALTGCHDPTITFERVEPGSYSVCRSRACEPIDVAATPAVQRFVVGDSDQ